MGFKISKIGKGMGKSFGLKSIGATIISAAIGVIVSKFFEVMVDDFCKEASKTETDV